MIINNLCPISNLSLAFKLVEEAAFSQTHDSLPILCLDKLMQVMNNITLNMNQQRVTLLVPLDLSTAFVTTHLVIPLDHLHTHFGISGHVHPWFKYHLTQQIPIHIYRQQNIAEFRGKVWHSKGILHGPLLLVPYASKMITIIKCHLPVVYAFLMVMTHQCLTPSKQTPARSNQL